MIIIHAYFKVNPQNRNEFLELAEMVTNSSQAEDGNISYQYYEAPEGTNHFLFLEKWKDEKAIQEHEQTSHFKSFVKEVEKLINEPFKADLYSATVIK
ncbi:putative quinol monooxygenase [Heyndrickxia acidicola]|uniref:Quinol monooxygenase n=1 Tax=Heyndrickxia acidicola TaxID=209389 RepID=A0ABU6MI28_9BACI|nr:putative quinol monooxygenase [Heyndrickxia acidicola]MED1204170.1 putative quinol monooxygenase [Heyndrickxia acidicola]